MQVDTYEAKTHLSRLLARVQAGEEVVITRRGTPVARLVPMRAEPPPAPVFGDWRSLPGWEGYRFDPADFAPLDDKGLQAEGWA